MIIQGTSIQIKEYRGKRVVTFKDIDTVHKRPEGTARRNFNQNRQRFISGVDFFKVCADEIRTHRIEDISPKAHEPLTLVTETGYLMLVKSFNDDLAWKVQRELVDSYFRVRAERIEADVPAAVIATDKLIRCAEIMAGCLEGNRPYVLNILKNIVPNIEEQKELTALVVMEDTVAEVPDVTEKVTVKKKRSARGCAVGWDYKKFDNFLYDRGITPIDIENDTGIDNGQICTYRRSRDNGGIRPGIQMRLEIEAYLGVPRGYFDICRRTRRTR
ncbi:ORF6N domain-containing protein [Mediterraneibacter glycyrrhizinilyticus]|nr:ORF6N domain-containing protein [Mediterraneibacter glycyrrhizinilyticus]